MTGSYCEFHSQVTKVAEMVVGERGHRQGSYLGIIQLSAGLAVSSDRS